MHCLQSISSVNKEHIFLRIGPSLKPSASRTDPNDSSIEGGSCSNEDEEMSHSDALKARLELLSSSYTSTASGHTMALMRGRTPSPLRVVSPPKCCHRNCDSRTKYAKYLESVPDLDKGSSAGAPDIRGRKIRAVAMGSDVEESPLTTLESGLSPDMSLVNLLRYCIVALQLLPDFSMSSEWLKFGLLYSFAILGRIILSFTLVLFYTRLPVTRWVKLSLNFEFLVPK